MCLCASVKVKEIDVNLEYRQIIIVVLWAGLRKRTKGKQHFHLNGLDFLKSRCRLCYHDCFKWGGGLQTVNFNCKLTKAKNVSPSTRASTVFLAFKNIKTIHTTCWERGYDDD